MQRTVIRRPRTSTSTAPSHRRQVEPDVMQRMLDGLGVHAVGQLREDAVHVLHDQAER